MYYICPDTNIFEHAINYKDIFNLHSLNSEFYKKNKMIGLSQVYDELENHKINKSEGFFQLCDVSFLPTTLDYQKTLYSNLYQYLNNLINKYREIKNEVFTLSQILQGLEKEKAENVLEVYENIISNGIFYLKGEENEGSYTTLCSCPLNILSKSAENCGIDYLTMKTKNETRNSLAMIIEKTSFGTETYKGLTHRDIHGMIGNFMFDYKNYKNKGKKQQDKIGKDAMVFVDLLFLPDIFSINSERDKIIFLSSDYNFLKEMSRFFIDIDNGILMEEYYGDLSDDLKINIKKIKNNIILIKINVENKIYENMSGKSSTQIEDVL